MPNDEELAWPVLRSLGNIFSAGGVPPSHLTAAMSSPALISSLLYFLSGDTRSGTSEVHNGGSGCHRSLTKEAMCINFGGLRIGGSSGIYNEHHYQLGHFECPPFNDKSMRSAYHVREFEIFQLSQIKQPLDIVFIITRIKRTFLSWLQPCAMKSGYYFLSKMFLGFNILIFFTENF